MLVKNAYIENDSELKDICFQGNYTGCATNWE